MASCCLFLLAQCPSVLISVWSSATLSSGGLSSRAGSPFGTRTHTMGLLMHSCSQPSGGKRGLERPGLDVAVTALAGGELTVGDEFWVRHGENGVTSDAFLEALVACKDRVCGPEFGGCHRRLRCQLPRRTPCCSTAWHTMRRGWRATPSFSSDGIWASRGGPRPPTVSCLSTRRW